MTSKATITNTQSSTLQMYQHPAFINAINRAANLKCLAAIRSGRLRVAHSSEPGENVRWRPRMDLIDDPTKTIITAVVEIPGIHARDLTLKIVDGQLILEGKRQALYLSSPQPLSDKKESNDSDPNQRLVPIQELRFGEFHRAIPVGKGIKDADVTAHLSEGILTLSWPRPSDMSRSYSETTSIAPHPLPNTTVRVQ